MQKLLKKLKMCKFFTRVYLEMNFPWNVSLYGHYLKELSMMCNLIFNHHLTSLKLEDLRPTQWKTYSAVAKKK